MPDVLDTAEEALNTEGLKCLRNLGSLLKATGSRSIEALIDLSQNGGCIKNCLLENHGPGRGLGYQIVRFTETLDLPMPGGTRL